MSGRRRVEDVTGREGEGRIGGGSSDPLVVRTADLAEALRPWVKQFNLDHDTQPTAVAPQSDAFSGLGHQERMASGFGGIHYLAHWAGVTETSVHRILTGKSQFTSLNVADKLLSAAGMTDVLHTSVDVVPNPMWSAENWERWREINACGDPE